MFEITLFIITNTVYWFSLTWVYVQHSLVFLISIMRIYGCYHQLSSTCNSLLKRSHTLQISSHVVCIMRMSYNAWYVNKSVVINILNLFIKKGISLNNWLFYCCKYGNLCLAVKKKTWASHSVGKTLTY